MLEIIELGLIEIGICLDVVRKKNIGGHQYFEISKQALNVSAPKILAPSDQQKSYYE